MMRLHTIEKYFKPISILDIGANVGDFTKDCKRVFPDAEYFLVEANSACESYLKHIGCDYFIGLLSDEEKVLKFYMNKKEPTSTGNSVYRENTEHFADENVIIMEMKAHTLDSIVHDRKFDLIKIDVQGSELDVLRGGTTVVERAKGIILELSLVEYNKDGSLQDEVMEYMESINYQPVEQLYTHFDSNGNVFQRDVLFLNRRYYGV